MASQIVRDTFSQAAQLNKPQNEPHTTREVQRGVGKEQVGFSTYRPILDAIVKAAKREGMTKTAWLDIAVIAVLRERYPDLYDMVRARRHEVTASRRDASQIPIDPE
jgi:hypothetical protein